MSLLEAERPVVSQSEGREGDPEGSIFLPAPREALSGSSNDIDALDTLEREFFECYLNGDGDVESILQLAATAYPDRYEAFCARLILQVNFDRGHFRVAQLQEAVDENGAIVKLNIPVAGGGSEWFHEHQRFLNKIIRHGLGGVALRGEL